FGNRQQPDGERHSAQRRGQEELAFHWTSGSGLEQRGYLLGDRELPAAGHRSVDLSARRPDTPARHETIRGAELAATLLETAGCLLTVSRSRHLPRRSSYAPRRTLTKV